MSQTVRNEESRSNPANQHRRCVEGATRAPMIEPEPVCLPTAYGNLMRLVDGRSGTVCLPLSSSGEIPFPGEAPCGYSLDPLNSASGADQIQALWNQVLAESN